MNLNRTYKIVVLEDNDSDFFLIKRELEKSSFSFTITRIETEKELLAIAEHNHIDLVLSDYNLPGFSGM